MVKKGMFSIVMPVWNRANIVSKAIKSVLSQSYGNYELIIVDDGSKDGLDEVVRPYLSQKVFYHTIAHGGVSGARNYALKHAHGEYIAYLDSDNVWHPEYLLTMGEALNRDNPPGRVAYCRCNVYKIDNTNSVLRFDSVRGENFNFKSLLSGNYIDLNTLVHAKECIDRVGFFDENLRRLVDWDYIVRLTAKFEPVFVPQVLVDYYLGLADNAITLIEDHDLAYHVIVEKNKQFDRPVIIFHDGIDYQWENVPDKKYRNWLRMSQGELDTTHFTANGYPFMLQIEPTNLCNLACPFCPAGRNDLGRERRSLTLEEFKSVIDDLSDYLLFLVMWGWGEPLLHPDLPDMIRYATSKGIKTVTSTNGHCFTNERYLADLLTSGLTTLIVAIDSLQQDNYEKFRKNGSLNKALEGLERTIKLKNTLGSSTHINMRMVITKQNEQELESLRAKAKLMGVDRFSVKTVNPSCDSPFLDEGVVPENPLYQRFAYKKNTYQRIRVEADCSYIWFICLVHSNGDIIPCCYDYDAKMAVGNIHTRKISEVWNGPEFRELRRTVTCERDSLNRCKNCDVNFKLSKTGWFCESVDFRKEREGGVKMHLAQGLKNLKMKVGRYKHTWFGSS